MVPLFLQSSGFGLPSSTFVEEDFELKEPSPKRSPRLKKLARYYLIKIEIKGI
jgi:hypothetical protein